MKDLKTDTHPSAERNQPEVKQHKTGCHRPSGKELSSFIFTSPKFSVRCAETQ
jgi:hypothetical protein